jgi:glyoxylase-like metal-dependent hydrolase (beta-lactamase superfamily II)
MSSPRVEPVVMDLVLPPGVLGPDAVTVDVRCFVVVTAKGILLVDAGAPGSSEAIGTVIRGAGATWSDVTDIVLTHNHFDHIGGLACVIDLAPDASVWSSAVDAPEIPSDRPHRLRHPSDGDRIGDLLVLHTPGHTAGHLSLMDEANRLALIGDVAGSIDGAVTFGPPAFNADVTQSARSLQRIADLRPDRILFSHGPELTDPGPAVRRLLT